MNFFYTYKTIDAYLSLFNCKKIKKRSKKYVEYYNIACAFDIETTSAYYDTRIPDKIYQANEIANLREKKAKDFSELNYEKVAFMYIWMLSIDNNLIVGRTWGEFKIVLDAIKKKFELSKDKYLIIYVHNLQFEFQYIKTFFEWQHVFASDEHRVIYAQTTNGFMFKCSYFLSNSSLDIVGKNLVKYKAEKQVGKLDYDLIRHYKTPLNDDEIKYCLYDVIVLTNYIKECIENENNNILKIPLTATGYVRRYCKQFINHDFERTKYRNLMGKSQMDDATYTHLKRAFHGGFTHSNALNTNIICENVSSYDITSSYPFVLVSEKYPIGSGQFVNIETKKELLYNINNYCCLFDCQLIDVKIKDGMQPIISKSKCFQINQPVLDNEKVASAWSLSITITEIDLICILKFYDVKQIKIGWFKRYKKAYLPKQLIQCILHFYNQKTKLKDVAGFEKEYQKNKSMLNSIFGMMVTDIVRDEIIFDGKDWKVKEADRTQSFENYNNSKSRFLMYEWGVWCTSYAFRNLCIGIDELKNDFIYCDTDSLKFFNLEKHKQFFENYNNKIDVKLKNVCKLYHLKFELFTPETNKGKIKKIGAWEFEGTYKQFKTLGAKRYLLNDNDVIKLTMAGVNKKSALPYMQKQALKFDTDVFNIFDDELYIPVNHTGKLLHTYIEYERDINVVDHTGIKANVYTQNALHLEATSYSLYLPIVYKSYIKNIKTLYTKNEWKT